MEVGFYKTLYKRSKMPTLSESRLVIWSNQQFLQVFDVSLQDVLDIGVGNSSSALHALPLHKT